MGGRDQPFCLFFAYFQASLARPFVERLKGLPTSFPLGLLLKMLSLRVGCTVRSMHIKPFPSSPPSFHSSVVVFPCSIYQVGYSVAIRRKTHFPLPVNEVAARLRIKNCERFLVHLRAQIKNQIIYHDMSFRSMHCLHIRSLHFYKYWHYHAHIFSSAVFFLTRWEGSCCGHSQVFCTKIKID